MEAYFLSIEVMSLCQVDKLTTEPSKERDCGHKFLPLAEELLAFDNC